MFLANQRFISHNFLLCRPSQRSARSQVPSQVGIHQTIGSQLWVGGDAGFKPRTAGQQSGALPLSHHTSLYRYTGEAAPCERRWLAVCLERISYNSSGATFFSSDGLFLFFWVLLLTVFKSFLPFGSLFILITNLSNSPKNCVVVCHYLLAFIHSRRYCSFWGRLFEYMVIPTWAPISSGSKPAHLWSSWLWQEAWESALHGVATHPVYTVNLYAAVSNRNGSPGNFL